MTYPKRACVIKAAVATLFFVAALSVDCQAQGQGTGGIPAVQEQLDEIQLQMAANLDDIMRQMAEDQAELLGNQAELLGNQAELLDSLEALKSLTMDVQEEVTPGDVNLSIQTCFNVQVALDAKGNLLTEIGKIRVSGSLGIDFYGNGAEVDAGLWITPTVNAGVGGSIGLTVINVCIELPKKKLFDSPFAFASKTAGASELPSSLAELADALEEGRDLVSEEIVSLISELGFAPGDLDAKLRTAMSLIENFEPPTDPLALLNPGDFQQQMADLVDLMPLGDELKAKIQDPASLIPTLDDLNICNNIPPGPLGDLIDDLCDLNPIPFNDFNELSTVVGDLGALTGLVNDLGDDIIDCILDVFDCSPEAIAAINARTTDTLHPFEANALQSRTTQTLHPVEEALPTEYALEASYPNPFNPTTTIRFDLPQTDHVTLKVYDVQGREVATLVSGSLSAGRHRVGWDASGLASGTYFYQLKAGSFIQTRLMLLLK